MSLLLQSVILGAHFFDLAQSMHSNNEFFTDQVSYTVNAKSLLTDLNIRIQLPRKVALIGLNGAGKTTLFRILTGELQTNSGQIRFGGLKNREHQFKSSLGYQNSEMRSLTTLNGGEFLDFCCVLKNIPESQREKTKQVIEQQWELGKLLSLPMSELSQGNCQKLALAQAFLGTPKFIFLDEPTQSLDPLEQERFIQNIKKLQDYQLCMFSSHNINETVEVADEVVLLHQGRVIAQICFDSPLEYWGVCTLNVDNLFESIEFAGRLLVQHQGPKIALVQIQFDNTNAASEFTEKYDVGERNFDFSKSIVNDELEFKLLGRGRDALLPIFSLLAEGNL